MSRAGVFCSVSAFIVQLSIVCSDVLVFHIGLGFVMPASPLFKLLQKCSDYNCQRSDVLTVVVVVGNK